MRGRVWLLFSSLLSDDLLAAVLPALTKDAQGSLIILEAGELTDLYYFTGAEFKV